MHLYVSMCIVHKIELFINNASEYLATATLASMWLHRAQDNT